VRQIAIERGIGKIAWVSTNETTIEELTPKH
jgi:hypothetical protein